MNYISRLKGAFLPILVAIVFSSAQANAVPITTSIGDYEVTTVLTSFEAYQDVFESQVWWGDVTLAEEFATLTNTVFGTPNFNVYTPFFWYTTTDTTGPCAGIGEPYAGIYWDTFSSRAVPVCAATAPGGPFTFAVAEAIVSVPEPPVAALMALGACLCGFSRLKRRNARI